MENSIIFSGDMLRVLPTKTQTRRIIKPLPSERVDLFEQALMARYWNQYESWSNGQRFNLGSIRCNYGTAGDTLWVREGWRVLNCRGELIVQYRADESQIPLKLLVPGGTNVNTSSAWNSPYHMPMALSRYHLLVESIRPEPLLSITPEDAIAEGIESIEVDGARLYRDYSPAKRQSAPVWTDSPIWSFRTLWNSINAVWKPVIRNNITESWLCCPWIADDAPKPPETDLPCVLNDNPWVWRIAFQTRSRQLRKKDARLTERV